MDEAEIEKRFTYHPPQAAQIPRFAMLRATGRLMAEEIVKHTPPSREQSLALTALEECVMWANAAIARNE
ncbi:MAG TPA: hypothetical protein DCQ64_24135 [Candidatus Rokubacteria bacterium]|nr:hypothetical protein [Candidatus Rokubacteria bacterium]